MRVLFAFLSLALALTVTVTVSAQTASGPNFYIIGSAGSNSYTFSVDGVDVQNPSFNLIVGTTYKFVLNASMTSHPFGFSEDNSGTIQLGDFTASDRGSVTSSGACTVAANSWVTSNINDPCIISITPPVAAAESAIYYRCRFHTPMVGTLNAVSATTTTPPTNGNATTTPPTNSTATTTPPTTTTPTNGTATTTTPPTTTTPTTSAPTNTSSATTLPPTSAGNTTTAPTTSGNGTGVVTTAPTTTPAPTNRPFSSTGGNGAAEVVPTVAVGVAVILAAINALTA